MPPEAKVITLCVIFGLYFLYQRLYVKSPEETRPECKDTLELHIGTMLKSYEFKNGKNNANFSYNSNVDVWCEGEDPGRIFLKKNGRSLSVASSTGNFLREHIEFICIDKETKCELSVLISAAPILGTINSETLDEFRGKYIMKYPKDSEFLVICTGPASSSLTMTKDGMRLQTPSSYDEHDKSSIHWSEEPDFKVSEYICTDSKTTLSTKATFRFVPDMYVHSQGNLKRPLYDYRRDKHEGGYRVGYGNFIEVFCTWPRAAKFIGLGQDEQLPSEFVNINTLKISKTVKEDSKFGCADSDSDYMRYVQIEVIPRMYVHLNGELIKPLHVEDRRVPRMTYRVNNGESIEVFCTWSRAIKLIMVGTDENIVPEIVNTDTVKLRKEIKERSTFGCTDSESNYMSMYVQIETDETIGQVNEGKSIDQAIQGKSEL